MCSRAAPKVVDVRSAPLRSVENQIDLQDYSGPNAGATHSKVTMEVSEDKIEPTNSNCAAISSPKIRSEPFLDNYTVEKEIGRGKFAVVKRCRHKQNGNDYAAKFLRKRRKGKDCRHEVLHEVGMLQLARAHPRLVDLVEVYENSHELILVTEYACGGELYQTVVLEERLHERQVVRLMRQVLEGVAFLHDRNIVHLDVKPNNILLTEPYPHGDIKLCDFGFARTVNSGDDVRDIIGTPDYVAPEVLSYEPIHTASDMWSVGVLAYVMLTGYSPFAGETKQETFLNISQVNLEFPEDLFDDISLDAQDFMTKLLCREPDERMTAKECLQHRWLVQSGSSGEDARMETAPPVSATLGDGIAATPKSPFGSPIGQRRALTPTTPDSSLELEPTKKCRCDSGGSNHSNNCNNEDAMLGNNVAVNVNNSNSEVVETKLNNQIADIVNDEIRTELSPECLNCSSSSGAQPDETVETLVSVCNSKACDQFENHVIDLENRNNCAIIAAADAIEIEHVARENINNEAATATACCLFHQQQQQQHPQNLVPKIEDLCCDAAGKLSQELLAKDTAVISDGDIDY